MTLRLRGMELDDRREVFCAVLRMAPAQRLSWLAWCCRQVSTPTNETRVIDGDGSMGQIFADLTVLEMQLGLDFEKAAAELIRRVRKL